MSRRELGAIGSQRESLSTNPLLIQSQVGKTRSRCFNLPPADFTYGINTVPLGGGVAEAVSCWKYHKARGKVEEREKDFIKLNKAATQAGLTTAHEHQTYRALNDIRKKPPDRSQTIPAVPDIVFGIKTRPSTPIYDLLENRFQERWLAEMREKDKKANIKVMSRKGKIYETRTSLLRRYLEPVDPLPYWKMKRWSKIPAELHTFRTNKERSDAFRYHASDRISRLGLLGQGIYQQAKS